MVFHGKFGDGASKEVGVKDRRGRRVGRGYPEQDWSLNWRRAGSRALSQAYCDKDGIHVIAVYISSSSSRVFGDLVSRIDTPSQQRCEEKDAKDSG